MIGALLTFALAGQAEDPSAALRRALPPLEKSSAAYLTQRDCFSCHHQALPLFALTRARRKGFAVDEENVQAQLKRTAEFLEGNKEGYRKGRGQGGRSATASYALWTLETGGWKADETTAAVVEYLLVSEKGRDHWQPPSHRPPSEASPFTATAFSLQALQTYGTADQKERVRERTARAREWLLKTPAADTEDRVFRLWALHYAGVEEAPLRAAARELRETQRQDGGWGQTDAMASDAYATGSALVALHEVGGLAATDPAYRRGVAFLLNTQREDGTWLVRTRSKPIQTYFESGFPHGKDQFISIAATGWAVAALAAACP
jgi:hypothetical protein